MRPGQSCVHKAECGPQQECCRWVAMLDACTVFGVVCGLRPELQWHAPQLMAGSYSTLLLIQARGSNARDQVGQHYDDHNAAGLSVFKPVTSIMCSSSPRAGLPCAHSLQPPCHDSSVSSCQSSSTLKRAAAIATQELHAAAWAHHSSGPQQHCQHCCCY